MSTVLTAEVLQDEVAVSLARVMAAANRRAGECGVDVGRSLITITQIFEGGLCWRVNYGPRDYVGQRGGDLLVDVDPQDASIKRTLRGQ